MGQSLRTAENHQGTLELKYTGLRPGEKLYEELLIDDEDTQTRHPRIMGADEQKLAFSEVVMLLDELNYELVNHNVEAAVALLQSAPLAYSPAKH